MEVAICLHNLNESSPISSPKNDFVRVSLFFLLDKIEKTGLIRAIGQSLSEILFIETIMNDEIQTNSKKLSAKINSSSLNLLVRMLVNIRL